MKKFIFLFALISFLFNFSLPVFAAATDAPSQMPHQERVKGNVIGVQILTKTVQPTFTLVKEKLQIKLEDGSEKNKIITIEYTANDSNRPVLSQGDELLLGKIPTMQGDNSYYVIDTYRLDKIVYVILCFFICALFVTGKKGLRSIIGLLISLIAIFGYLIPQILKGADPVITSVFTSFFILFIITYIAHGISRQTTVAFFSTCIGLILTIIFSSFAIHFTGLTGYGTKEALDMHFLTTNTLNVKGLFLAGIIITTLGALNDVTITQATVVFQLAKQKEKRTFLQLAQEGIIVGREHAISLVNTLVLAYTGGALSVLIYFFVSQTQQPVESILGNEFLAEEIVRTIGGTIGLILSVPLATYLAAYICNKE